MQKRGQVSVEYMAMVGLSLAAFFVIWLYVNSSNAAVQQDLKVGFGKQVVTRLADAANLVFVQGTPAKMFVEVNNPDGVLSASPSSNATCSSREIMLVLTALDGKTTQVFAPVSGNVSGDLSFLVGKPGLRRIQVEAVDFNGFPCVLISG
ncbi:MAG: hypothetical protein QXR53_03525 [Candidatus Norongarragalinales archaeon]